MTIGILGGTFNPIHNGHLYIASAVLEYCAVSQILFVPTGQAPHKRGADVVDKWDRYNMVSLALDDERFGVSDIETRESGLCYAVDTIGKLIERYPRDRLVYIIGYDCIPDLYLWKDYARLLGMVDMIAVKRGGKWDDALILKLIAEYTERYDASITVPSIPAVAISSTDIRDRLKNGKSVAGLVPDAVMAYMQDHSLYR